MSTLIGTWMSGHPGKTSVSKIIRIWSQWEFKLHLSIKGILTWNLVMCIFIIRYELMSIDFQVEIFCVPGIVLRIWLTPVFTKSGILVRVFHALSIGVVWLCCTSMHIWFSHQQLGDFKVKYWLTSIVTHFLHGFLLFCCIWQCNPVVISGSLVISACYRINPFITDHRDMMGTA